jgi:hypothetical protein
MGSRYPTVAGNRGDGDDHVAADCGWCASHSRYFWGFRLHAIVAPDGTPRALALTSPKADERDVALQLLARCERRGGEILLGDKGYAGRAFAQAVRELDAKLSDRAAATSPAEGRTSRRSVSASRASSGPAKTSSPSNATAPVNRPGSPTGDGSLGLGQSEAVRRLERSA